MTIAPSLEVKLNHLVSRYEIVSEQLSLPETVQDQEKYKALSKEFSQLEPTVTLIRRYQENKEAFEQAEKLLLEETDAQMKALVEEEMQVIKVAQENIEDEIKIQLLPEDPNDASNVFLEVRAGTGGDEASIFAGDLFRMYARFAESKRWKLEIVSEHLGEHGGYKEVIARVIGKGVYSQLKFESGAHRVQRVPETESQGRVHTSACTVAILPEIEEINEIEMNPADLRIDTFRASGAGGQHVNKTDSAIRITHLPTGVVVECQDDRSQHKNKAKALKLLQSRLVSNEQQKQKKEQADTRRSLVGSGDRSERIRTYNFPQGRVTDHRINLTLYKLDEIMEGVLESVIEPLIREHQADLLAHISK